MNRNKRVFLIVLDSFGVGELPDAVDFGDVGANTLGSVSTSSKYNVPNLKSFGFHNIDGVTPTDKVTSPIGSYGRCIEQSRGKDTTIGHWEMAGMISNTALPTFPEGFPQEILDQFEELTGRKVLCNLPYSGTAVIEKYGEEHMKTGALIVYTSGDSVFQIAAHEDIVPLEQLYKYCEMARGILTGPYAVGRVIARPFVGEPGNFTRTSNRHDFSLVPPKDTMLDMLVEAGYDTYGVGKIYDIFAGKGVQHTQRITNNVEGMEATIELLKEDFNGLCFVNLVDFDMKYGHRRDIDGYANAASVFDEQLTTFMENMREDDIVMVTADHGCDPGFKGTDHTREYIPILAYGKHIKAGVNIGTRHTYADIAATVLDVFKVENHTDGTSFYSEIEQA